MVIPMNDLLPQAKALEAQFGAVSSALLQRKLKINHFMATQIIGELRMEKHKKAREFAKQVKEELGVL